ncbi:MAG: alanyl-tRNA editing protein AlaXM [Anaerolineae bacterium]
MTELLYQTDSYLKDFTATITGVDAEQNGILLNRTAFYPGGGGQPADSGTLRVDGKTYTVTGVGKGNLHLIQGALPPVGAEAQGTIDWERRYRLMRTHTAMHVLCGVVWRDYSASVTGGNMEPLSARMDFEFERMDKSLVSEIEAAINAEVQKASDVRITLLPRAEAFQIPDLIRTKVNLIPESVQIIRTVEIVGLDLQACGGTHLANVGEIGTIHIPEYKSKGGINKRIYVQLDE